MICETAGTTTLVDDVEVSTPRANEVLIQLAYCSLCHSDLSFRDGGMTPSVLGHEASGVAIAVGAGVSHVTEGDHVVATVAVACGRCDPCTSGHPAACLRARIGELPDGGTGFTRDGSPVFRAVGVGGFAERVVMPASAVVSIPPDFPLELACLLGCGIGTGLGAAINTANVSPGQCVIVMGAGGVGMAAVQGAQIAGAARIIAVDPVEDRRAMALELGATDAVAPSDEVGRELRRMTGGGAHHVIETSGRQESFRAGLIATRNGGAVTVVGMPNSADDTLVIDRASSVILGEKQVRGSSFGSCQPQRDIPRFIALERAGSLNLRDMITQYRPLSEVDAAIEDLQQGRGLRTVIELAV